MLNWPLFISNTSGSEGHTQTVGPQSQVGHWDQHKMPTVHFIVSTRCSDILMPTAVARSLPAETQQPHKNAVL